MIFDIMEDSSQKLLDLHPDIIVASDLLYGEAIAKGLGHQLGVAASNGVTIITTDAGRMEGQGQRIFLEHFQNACSAVNVSSTSAFSFLTEKIPDGILDLGLNAMKYGGQVDRAVGVFEFPPPNPQNPMRWSLKVPNCQKNGENLHWKRNDGRWILQSMNR